MKEEENGSFDLQAAAASLGLPEAVYRSFLIKALDEGVKLVGEIEKALENNQREIVRAHAHRLKGDFGNLRIEAIMALAKEINEKASNADTETLKILVNRLRQNMTMAQTYLRI